MQKEILLTDVLCIVYTFVVRGCSMNFYSVRDLRTSQKEIWGNLAVNGEAVITNNGKPTALLVDLENRDFEAMVKAVRQAKAMMAFNSMRERACENGFMSDEEIMAEINAARRGE